MNREERNLIRKIMGRVGRRLNDRMNELLNRGTMKEMEAVGDARLLVMQIGLNPQNYSREAVCRW